MVDRNFNGRRINVAVGKQRDGTFMTGCIRVVMKKLVQLGCRRHCVQQQDKTDQQRGKNCLAVPLEMSDSELQTFCF